MRLLRRGTSPREPGEVPPQVPPKAHRVNRDNVRTALDWFAGDPPVIRSFSETWANVAAEVNKANEQMGG